MKKYIYEIENGQNIVIETSMPKPKEHFVDGNMAIQVRASYRTEIANYSNHISTAPRIEVIGTIPAYWKKGEEVNVLVRKEQWMGSSKTREIAIPIDKAVEPEHIADTGKMIDNRGELYYHDVHCNAGRDKPMGCEICSCFMYQRARKAEFELNKLTTPQPTDNSCDCPYCEFCRSEKAFAKLGTKPSTTSLERDKILGEQEVNNDTLKERQKWFDQKRGENRSY